jgi:hypothetical protein
MAKNTAIKTGSVGGVNLANLMKPTGAMTEFMRNLGLESDEENEPSAPTIPHKESPVENSGKEIESVKMTESELIEKGQVQSPAKVERKVAKLPTVETERSKDLDVYVAKFLTIPKKAVVGHRRYFVSKRTHKILSLLKSHAELDGEVFSSLQLIENILMNHFRLNAGVIKEIQKRVLDAQEQLDL